MTTEVTKTKQNVTSTPKSIEEVPKRNVAYAIRFVILDIFLVVLAVAGFHGGLSFIRDPAGYEMQLNTILYKIEPIGLNNWFIPGCFLFTQFGILPLVTLVMLFINKNTGIKLCYHILFLMLAWIGIQVAILGLMLPSMQIGCVVHSIVIAALALSLV